MLRSRKAVWLMTLVTVLCLAWQQPGAQVLVDEQFSTDVIGEGSWSASDASVTANTDSGWLQIGSGYGYDSRAVKHLSTTLPLVLEARVRLSGGLNVGYSLPLVELYDGFSQQGVNEITFAPEPGWGWSFLGQWTGIQTLGPTEVGQWRTVKAIIRSDGGDLFAKADGDSGFTYIVSRTWSISNHVQELRLRQPWDATCDFDYVKVSTVDTWCDDFESGLANWDLYQYPSGWAASTTNPHSGLTCAMFTFPSGAGYYDASMRSTSGLFYVEAGVTYSVTYWIREQNTHDTWASNQSILDIGIDIGTGGANDRIAPFALPISSEWQLIEGSVTASVSGAAAINVELHGYATSDDALFAIDDICIRPSPPPVTTVAFDIKPGSCPNPFNLKSDDGSGHFEEPIDEASVDAVGKKSPYPKAEPKDVLPTAVLGTSLFDVTTIDVSSVRLNGVAPVRSALEDVGAPQPANAPACACNTTGPDGITDLTIKFYRAEVERALGPVQVGDVISLEIVGKLKDGSDFEGHDCIVIVGNPNAVGSPFTSDNPVALSNYPNPFNPVTTISFAMPQAGYAKLDIYNTLGQMVATLVDEKLEAGVHAVTWDASGQASGLYLYRLTTSDFAETKKMLLLK